MLLGIDNFTQFKIFFDVVYDISELVELQLFKDYMICNILDKAHARFMSVRYNSDFFSLYEVDDAESVTLYTEDMNKIIKAVNKIDSVVLQTNEDYLICKIESDNGNFRVFEFVLPPDYIETPQPPSLSLPVKFNLNLSELKQGVKDLGVIGSDVILLTAKNNMLTISAGIDIATNYVSNIVVDIVVEESVSSMFNKEYVEQLLKFDKINNVVELEMGDNYPLVYSFKDEVMGVEVKGLIAPRLEIQELE